VWQAVGRGSDVEPKSENVSASIRFLRQARTPARQRAQRPQRIHMLAHCKGSCSHGATATLPAGYLVQRARKSTHPTSFRSPCRAVPNTIGGLNPAPITRKLALRQFTGTHLPAVGPTRAPKKN